MPKPKKPLTDEEKAAAKRARAKARRDAQKARSTRKKVEKLEDPELEDDPEFDIDFADEQPTRGSAKRAKKTRGTQENARSTTRAPRPFPDPTAPEAGPRGCHATNLLNEPCGGIAIKASTSMRSKDGKKTFKASGGYCIMHDPALPDPKELGVGGAQKGTGPKPKPRADEVMRAVLASAPLAFLRPYMDALGVEVDPTTLEVRQLPGHGLKLFGTSKEGDVFVSEYEDIGGQMKAAEMILDRVLGRPKQATELTGADGGNVVVEVPWSAERASKVAEVLRNAGAIPNEKK